MLDNLIGVYLHWNANEKRTSSCEGQACAHCKAGTKQQWKSFAPAVLWQRSDRSWNEVIAEITESAHAELLTEEFRPIVQWRGTGVALKRVGTKVKAQVEDRPVAGELPPAWDVKPTLVRMLGGATP